MIHVDVAENSTDDVRTNKLVMRKYNEYYLGILLHVHLNSSLSGLQSAVHLQVRGSEQTYRDILHSHKDAESTRKTLQTKEILAVGGDIDLVHNDFLLLASVLLSLHSHLRNDLVQLNSEFEAKLVKFLIGEGLSQRPEQHISLQGNVRHGD